LRPALDTWDPSFFDWGDDATPIDDTWFRLAGEPAAEVLAPLAPRFRGKVVVLVDAHNSSATFQFAQRVQRAHLATLVGEPTGGNQRGINGGAFFFLRLPATGLEIDLPLIARYPRDGKPDALPDAGLTPDVLVLSTAADVAAGRDPQLAAARRL
jgi:C-terminal processing protease CtpA/Prc